MTTQSPITVILDETPSSSPPSSALQVLHEWVTTVDHKKIGLMYIGYALLFLVIAGFQAILMRIQLAIPNNTFVSPQVFNRLFTMHGTTMVFFVGMPILFGFGNYLIPLMIGARDMAFPRLNAFSFWISAFGGFLLYFSYFGASGLSAYRACVLPWSQHRLLDPFDFAQRRGQHRHSRQHCGNGTLHALPGDEIEPDATVGMALPGDGDDGLCCGESVNRRADHADARSLSGRALF
jgi:hypothetical protein